MFGNLHTSPKALSYLSKLERARCEAKGEDVGEAEAVAVARPVRAAMTTTLAMA